MDTDQLKTIAASLTKAERTAFLSARPYPQDGRVVLPSGRVLELGSWAAAMELNNAIYNMAPPKGKKKFVPGFIADRYRKYGW
jgi:hypothetical protein